MNIMVVEDQPDVAEWISNQLVNLGYGTPIIYFSGKQALKRIENGSFLPELVLMDINFDDGISKKNDSDYDGIETAKIMHERYQIPIVFLTGTTDSETLHRAAQTGAFGYMVKPIVPDDLRRMMEMIVSKSRQLERERQFDVDRARAFIEGQDRERIRIAEELHEEIGTNLSAVSNQLSIIESAAAEPDINITEVSTRLQSIREELNRTIHAVRLLSSQLAPLTLVNLGIEAASAHFLRMYSEKIPYIQLEYDVSELEHCAIHFDSTAQISIYRIITELIDNIYVHSGADNARLECVMTEKGLEIMIEDNGSGFDPTLAFQSETFGLKTVMSRVKVLKGNLKIDSIADSNEGTFVNIFIPIIKTE